MVPILAYLCYLVVNLVSFCMKNNPLNANTTFSHKIIVFYFIGPHVSGVLNCVQHRGIYKLVKQSFPDQRGCFITRQCFILGNKALS